MLADKLFRFAIDRINGRFITGWCFHRIMKNRPVAIRVAADNHHLGSVSCTGYRRDLKEQKLHPTGCCGFDFSFPAAFDPGHHSVLHLYFDSCTRPQVSVACRDLELLRPAPGRPIFFMHIPKTAGTSFNAFVRNCFSRDDYLPHIERLTPVQRQTLLPRARYLSGHIPWREIAGLLDPGRYDLYAIVRNPYAHLHSHLNYVRCVHTDAEHEVHYHYRHNETIRDLARRLAGIDFRDDRQIRRLVAELSGYECDFFDNIQTRYFLDYRPERVTQADYLQAVQNMMHFRSIGLTERYDRFRDRFCRDLGLPPQSQTLRSNRSERYRLVDLTQPSSRSIIDPLVRFDCRLYDLVAEQCGEDTTSSGDTAGATAHCRVGDDPRE